MKSLKLADEYTAIAKFNNELITVNIKIPREDTENPYQITVYNATKLSVGRKINAIYCHLKLVQENGHILSSAGFDHTININTTQLNQLTSHTNNVPYDQSLNETLIIVLHEDHNNSDDREMIFSNIENYFDRARNGNYTDYLPNINPKSTKSKNIPRVVGVSIITRS